jgi:hypothetical protein
MSKDFNDNHDKSNEDEDEFKDEFNDEDEGTSTDEEEEDDENSSEEDEGNDDDEDSEEGSKEDKQKKKDEAFLAKFKDKKPEEIIEMYKNLEKKVDSIALKKAQKLLEGAGVKVSDKKVETEQKKQEDEDDFDLTDDQIKKMSPKEFAQWADKRITLKATKIASEIISKSNEVRDNVKREISEATKAHPHLKTNKQYRDIVLDKIEASKSRGKTITLKEACKMVDEAMGIKPGEGGKKEDDNKDEKKEEKKKPRTEVEKQDGTDAEKTKTEEDQVLEGMMSAGGKKSVLGGLGI